MCVYRQKVNEIEGIKFIKVLSNPLYNYRIVLLIYRGRYRIPLLILILLSFPLFLSSLLLPLCIAFYVNTRWYFVHEERECFQLVYET